MEEMKITLDDWKLYCMKSYLIIEYGARFYLTIK